jgi:uncharacterized lipoprotein NlpE involved in copper resistance
MDFAYHLVNHLFAADILLFESPKKVKIMKKLSPYLFLFLSLTLSSCVQQNSQKNATQTPFVFNGQGMFFSGSYVFSDMESMHTAVMLLPDSLFLLLRRVNDEPRWQANAGNWSLQKDHLLLDGGNESRLLAKWTGSNLEVLSNSGEPIFKQEKFVLAQIPSDSAAKLSFELTGAYRWFADAASMRFCYASRQLPVMMVEANMEAERAFLEHREYTGKDELFISAYANLTQNPETESSFKSALRLHSLVKTFPEMECY